MIAPYRTLLFVPGHKVDWVDKALRTGADAIVLDLEDSVPAGEKEGARVVVRQQPIRRLCLRPAPTRHRNARAGLCAQLFRDPHQPPVQPGIAQICSRQFCRRPT